MNQHPPVLDEGNRLSSKARTWEKMEEEQDIILDAILELLSLLGYRGLALCLISQTMQSVYGQDILLF